MRNATASESVVGKQALFAKHPEMRSWPSDHMFHVYTLDISDVSSTETYAYSYTSLNSISSSVNIMKACGGNEG